MLGKTVIVKTETKPDTIIFSDIPLPTKDGYREIFFKAWEVRNETALKHAKDRIREWHSHGLQARVDTFACGVDVVQNRLLSKCLQDALGTTFAVSYKESLETKRTKPWCMVLIRPWKKRQVEALTLYDL